MGVAMFHQPGPDNRREPRRKRQDLRKFNDSRQQLAILADDLVLLKTGEPVQAHIEEGLRLNFTQQIAVGDQPVPGRPIGRAGGRTPGPGGVSSGGG